MQDPVRQEVIALAHSVVVKIGTNVLTNADGLLDLDRLQSLVDQVHRLRQAGRKVTIVSSGAIGAGVGQLKLDRRPADLRSLQACAAVGQGFLMRAYQECFRRHDSHVAQILLTAGDFDNRTRYLNARNTILTLLEWNCVPVINENDTVSVAEIRFGDNDHLAAMVTNLLQAPLLLLLTVVDGLCPIDPGTGARAEPLRTVPSIDGSIMDLAGPASSLGTGGMRSKLRAARLATAVVNQLSPMGQRQALSMPFFGPNGRHALLATAPLPAWKRWLGFTAQPKGKLTLDGPRAVAEPRARLLPIGIVQMAGTFAKGMSSLSRGRGQRIRTRPFQLRFGRRQSTSRTSFGPDEGSAGINSLRRDGSSRQLGAHRLKHLHLSQMRSSADRICVSGLPLCRLSSCAGRPSRGWAGAGSEPS